MRSPTCAAVRLAVFAIAGLLTVSAASAAGYVLGGTTYGDTAVTETGTAVFTTPDAFVTTNNYSNFVKIEVEGTGQSAGTSYNDAFYVFSPGVPGHNAVHYQLNLAKVTLVANTLSPPVNQGKQAYKTIVFDLDTNTAVTPPSYVPAYRSDHSYQFIANVGAGASQLHFGVSDGQFSDNSGAFTIKVTQLDVGPTIQCNSPLVLWPPDHELIDVSSAFTVLPPEGMTVTFTVRVFSDESEVPETGDGTGKHAPDFKDEQLGRGILLRAERAGTGDGRIYIGLITATASNGAFVTEWCILGVVPHEETLEALEAVLEEAAIGLESCPPREHGLADPLGPKQ